jgi:RNA polymerase sigma factor (sigma-70 family)
VSEASSDIDISGWSSDRLRDRCFGTPPGASRWHSPGSAFVSQRLQALIARRLRKDARVRGREPDLYQRVYEDVWKRFDQIHQSFIVRGGELRWRRFEAYLQVSLRHSLGKAIGGRANREEPRDEVPTPPVSCEIEPRLDARRILDQGFAALSGDERDALRDLHVLGRTTAETARRLGLTPAAVYKLRHRALRRFRNEVIRILGESLLRPSADHRVREALVRERCHLGHACFLYKLECRAARGPDELAAKLGAPAHAGSDPAALASALAHFARELSQELAQRGIPSSLDACIWEPRPGSEAEAERDRE